MLRHLVTIVIASVLVLPVLGNGAAMASADEGARPAQALPDADRSKTDQEELARLLAIAKQTKAPVKSYKVELDISAHPYIGSADAPLVVVEFGSYQCGFCRRHFEETMPAIETEFIDTGRLRYVFFDFALDPRHEHAARAAEAAHCANDQKKFWAYRERLFGSDKLDAEALIRQAESAGLDTVVFEQCLESQRYRATTEADRALSRKLRVRGTPSFFLGKSNADDERVEIVKRISGARPFALFSEHIETLYANTTGGRDSQAISTWPPLQHQH